MPIGPTLMLIGIALFFGPHTYSAFRSRHPGHDVRARRETGYMIAYSLVSLIGLILIVQGYQRWAASPVLYPKLPGMWVVTAVAMLPAFILFVAGNLPAGRIRAAVKHPMVLGTFLWAASHLVTGASLRKLALFAPFAAWALVDFLVARRRPAKDVTPDPKWDAIAVGVGLFAYIFTFLYAHMAWIGVSPE